MKYYYITGTGKGIGKTLAEILIEQPDTIVFGLSRNNSITHPNFRFIKTDLTNQNEVSSFQFQDHSDASQVCLVNNAGILGHVDFVGKIDPGKINDVISVNYISAFILSNSFIKKYQEKAFVKVILNVGSGAGRHPFESWSLYCSSKAALDMLSRVISDEQKTLPAEKLIYVFSVAPGIVDTNMQTEIRNLSKDQFPKRDAFIGYFKNNELSSTLSVALKIKSILDTPEKFQEVLLDLRNL